MHREADCPLSPLPTLCSLGAKDSFFSFSPSTGTHQASLGKLCSYQLLQGERCPSFTY